MTSKVAPTSYQAKRQALVNLALTREPTPLRPKSVFSAVDDSPARSGIVEIIPLSNLPVNELPSLDRPISILPTPQMTINELPSLDRPISIISTPLMTINELPSASATTRPSSARSNSFIESIL